MADIIAQERAALLAKGFERVTVDGSEEPEVYQKGLWVCILWAYGGWSFCVDDENDDAPRAEGHDNFEWFMDCLNQTDTPPDIEKWEDLE